MKILIVGAGLSGCVIADLYARLLNAKITIIDKRDHVGGNCYDYIDDNGIRINKYGAHLFHTSNERVYKYIHKYSDWVYWEHKVLGIVDDKYVPIPVNIETVNKVCDENIKSSYEMRKWLSENQEKFKEIKNGEQAAQSRVGKFLYEKIFKEYTKKQWDKYPDELDASVLARIPVREDFSETYFTDKYQLLPLDGYTKMFENLLNNPNIKTLTNTDFFTFDTKGYDKIFYTGPIDVYFHNLKKNKLPALEYRSINFEIESVNVPYFQPNSVVNYPGNDVDFTRIVEYKHFLYQESENTTIVREYSCDNGDPYYPVPNKKNRSLYEKYKSLALREKNVYFVGRLANYKYFNMDQAILNAIEFFENIEGSVDIEHLTFQSIEKNVEKDLVIESYNKILRRDPEEEGLNVYIKFIKSGKKQKDLEEILYSSEEYKSIAKYQVKLQNYKSGTLDIDIRIIFYKTKKEILQDIVNNYENFNTTIYAPESTNINEYMKICAKYFGQFVSIDPEYIFDESGWTLETSIFSITKEIIHKKSKIYFEACASIPPASWSYLFCSNNEYIQLVVARYKEDIKWTSLFDDVLIYNKGPVIKSNTHCIFNLPNIGREGGTYLTHIIKNYEMLAEYTIFSQGCPFEHSPDFIHLLKDFSTLFNYFQPLTWRWKENDTQCSWFKDVNPTGIPPMENRDLTRFLHMSNCKIHMEILDGNFNCIFPLIWEDGGFNHHLIPRLRKRNNIPHYQTVLEWIYKKLKLDCKPPEYFPFCFAANFGVHRDNIKRYDISFYQNMEKFLHEHEDHGYLIERLWAHIFL
jgi:UDP-galactopyranose mutase